jgi:hypothetical protein
MLHHNYLSKRSSGKVNSEKTFCVGLELKMAEQDFDICCDSTGTKRQNYGKHFFNFTLSAVLTLRERYVIDASAYPVTLHTWAP